MEWTDGYHETTLCASQTIFLKEMVALTLAGFRAALTRVINNYAIHSGDS